MGSIVPPVKMDGFTLHQSSRQPRIRWQIIPVPYNNLLANLGFKSGTRHGAVVAIDLCGINPARSINDDLIASKLALRIPGG